MSSISSNPCKSGPLGAVHGRGDQSTRIPDGGVKAPGHSWRGTWTALSGPISRGDFCSPPPLEVEGLGAQVEISGFVVQGLRFMVSGLGFKVWG